MKKVLTMILAVMLCGLVAACNTGASQPAVEGTQPTATAAATAAPTVTMEATAAPENAKDAKTYIAYADALENLLKNRILPDGMQSEEQDSAVASRFAVYDVDGDGSDELILLNHTVTMAGTSGYVFDYQEGATELSTELLESTDLTFYDNGIVKAMWSHNQGLAGDFWPYNIQQYDASIDCYRPNGGADAWDKNYRDTNDENQPFPNDVDTSGTGIVYFLLQGNEYDNTHPVDKTAYDAWVAQMIGSAKELTIPYFDLTEDNIALLRAMV